MLLLISSLLLASSLTQEHDLESVKSALRNRQSEVQTIQATYSVWHGRLGLNPHNVTVPQTYRWTSQGVRKTLESDTWIVPGTTDQRRDWFSFDGHSAYSVWFAPQYTEYSFEIYKRKAIDSRYSEDAFLAFAFGDCVVWSSHSLQGLLIQPDTVVTGVEEMGGVPVVRVEVAEFNWREEWKARLTAWLSPQHDWLPKKIDVELIGTKEQRKRTGLMYEMDIDKFSQVADSTTFGRTHWYPSEFHFGQTRCQVTDIKINNPVTIEAFRPPMPTGAVFIDETRLQDIAMGTTRLKAFPKEVIGGDAGQKEHERISQLLRVPSPTLPEIDTSGTVTAMTPKLVAELPDRMWLIRLVRWLCGTVLFAIAAFSVWRRCRT